MKPYSHYCMTLLGPVTLEQAQEWIAQQDDELTITEEGGSFYVNDPMEPPRGRSAGFSTIEGACEFAAFILQLPTEAAQ